MKELVRQIVLALVDDPDAVSVAEVVGEQAHVLELHVAPSNVVQRVLQVVAADAERSLGHFEVERNGRELGVREAEAGEQRLPAGVVVERRE